MSRIFASLVISIAFFCFAIPAQSQTVVAETTGVSSDNGPAIVPPAPAKSGPSILGYVGFGSGYIYQDFGFMASTKPVIYGGTTFTWDSGDSLDFWTSKGAGGAANEADLCYWHNGLLGSSGIDYQAKGCYYFLSGGKNYLSTFADDAFYEHFDMGRTFTWNRVSVGLRSKTEFIEGLNDTPFFVVERVGVPVDFNVTDTLSAEVEVARAWNLTSNGHSPWEFTPALTWHAGTTSFILKDKMAEADHRVLHEVMFEIDVPLN